MGLDPVAVVKCLRKVTDDESTKYYTPYAPVNRREYKCSVENCPNFAYAKKLCNAHYLRKRLGSDTNAPLRCRKKAGVCVECGKASDCKGGWNRCRGCYKNRRRSVIKAALVSLLGGCCTKCKLAFPACVYDFHHLQDKQDGISLLIDGHSIKRLAEEIVKCVLMCANCHRLETYGAV